LAFDFNYVFGNGSALSSLEKEILKRYLNYNGWLIFEKKGLYLYAL
tara:strand:- start:400 stop:537 length:138 start_codon:yes stop_codon:yes gene_type:complete